MERRSFAFTGLTFIALAAAALPSMALTPLPAQTAAVSRGGMLAQIGVVDRASGRELPLYPHRGDYWVEGRPGARYAIRITNAIGERVMAVMSVDGINVLSGEAAGYGQNGYVFGAGQQADIAGWRKSNAQIAAFEFTSIANSYAGRTGRPDNVGVIGIALCRERYVAPPPPPPLARNEGFADRERGAAAKAQAEASSPAQSASADRAAAAESGALAGALRRPAPAAPSLGTGHGRRETSYVSQTSFERAQSAPDEVIQIRYGTRDELIAAGVIPRPLRHPRPVGPTPFPESTAGYVPDPPARY